MGAEISGCWYKRFVPLVMPKAVLEPPCQNSESVQKKANQNGHGA